MSYDLRIAVRVAGAEDLYAVIAEPKYSSPTYNIGDMFRACTGWDFNQGEWYKVTDVYQNIVRGVLELTNNEPKYRKYNSPNGWGDTESALKALKSLKTCIDSLCSPDGWGWNCIPKEYLYVAW